MSDRGAGRGNPPQTREMQRNLIAARDEQIARVVAVVDALADRSAADALIAPLRPRLMQLRPPRPMRLARLLFLPLDPLIVPAPRWRPGDPLVPRTALTPLTNVVSAAGSAVVAQVEASLAGIVCGDTQAVADAGALLWPAAARALTDATAPESWSESGLKLAEFAPIARGVAGALEGAPAVQRVVAEARQGLAVRPEVIDTVLEAAAKRGPEAWNLTFAMLLARLPNAAPVLQRVAANAARGTDPASRARAERVAEAVLDGLEQHGAGGPVGDAELSAVGAEVRRIAALLEAIDGPGATTQRRRRVQELRHALDASSRTRFQEGIASEFVAPLREQLEAAGPIDVDGLEGAARTLRKIETAGRRIGSAKAYDTLLRSTAQDVMRLDERPGLSLADKVRMVEVLAGPDEAMAMLGAP
ncbi:MAG: hypothetical protein ABI369_12655 [Acetobacteraceae bacterium]